MINIQDISVRKRLMLIFSVWMMIFIGFGAFVLRGMSNLGNISEKIFNHPLQVSNAAIEARVNVIKIQRSTRDLILTTNVEDIKNELDSLRPLEQTLLYNLDTIRDQTLLNSILEMEKETRKLVLEWNSEREKIIKLVESGDREQAAYLVKHKMADYASKSEALLIKIDNAAVGKATDLVKEAEDIEAKQKVSLIIAISGICAVFFIVFTLMINSILGPITQLKGIMDMSINSGKLSKVDIHGNNEIADMSKYYNAMIDKLRSVFWVKDRESLLNQELSGYITLEEISQRAINFLCRTLSAGKGVVYIYDRESNSLRLEAGFAITEKEKLSTSLSLGEGTVGQVALEKKAILLKNIKRDRDLISTAIVSGAPLNSYAFPLIYEDELYGVIELATLELFKEEELEFLSKVSGNIAINIYSAMQSQQISHLLEVSEKTNEVMHKQQIALQQRTEELQHTNTELEEQQQLLQQQSEELQQTNQVLEEQQRQLEEQTRLLDVQNRSLQESRREVLKRSEELEVINKYKSEFLANMSHELRTPLNSIILLSKLLLNKGKERLGLEEQQKIDVINKSGHELLRLINDVLDLSKIEAGATDLEKQIFHSSSLAKEVNDMFESLAKEKGLEFCIEDNLNQSLFGDKYKIAQVLRNLLSNAIKFTDKGSVYLVISKDHQNERGVIFTVKDTGIGISKEKRNIIFEEFQQGDGSISRKYGGTGLGLSISKKLVELMEGKIKVHSVLGKGSDFILFIPELIAEEGTGNVPALISEAEVASAVEKYDGFQMEFGKVILVIEDDVNFAQYIKDTIDKMGFTTIIGRSGKSGLELAKKYRPMGILLDLGLPDMSGMDVLRELKSITELRNIPVHIISVNDKDNRPQRAGAIGYHQKPVEENEVVKLVGEMISFSEKSPKRILLIEDNKVQQEVIQELIEDKNVLIQTVDTEEAAKSEIERESYDVIILDLKLKEGNGLNICKFIGEKRLNTPVIVYTGRELTVEEEKNIRKFVDSIIIKTANSEERLLDEVTLFLHKIRKSSRSQYEIIPKICGECNLSLEGKSILIVDDDPRNVYTLASALEDCKANIIEADNGKSAIQKLKEEHIDLVLMDIMMPEMDGYETIRQIRKDNKLKHIPIIAVTAKSLKEDRAKCIQAGANDYITKPVDYDNLSRLIKAWVAKEK